MISFINKIFFSLLGKDYSVKIPQDRETILEKLSKYEKVDIHTNTNKLVPKLYKYLIKNHPIRELLANLSNIDVKNLYSTSAFRLKEIQGGSIDRMRNAIAHYFFFHFEECPMTSLEKVLIEKGITVVTEQQGKKHGTK